MLCFDRRLKIPYPLSDRGHSVHKIGENEARGNTRLRIELKTMWETDNCSSLGHLTVGNPWLQSQVIFIYRELHLASCDSLNFFRVIQRLTASFVEIESPLATGALIL